MLLGNFGYYWVLLGCFGYFWVLAETGKRKLTIASIDHNLVLLVNLSSTGPQQQTKSFSWALLELLSQQNILNSLYSVSVNVEDNKMFMFQDSRDILELNDVGVE